MHVDTARDGTPLDRWGTPIGIRAWLGGEKRIVEVTAAGPDEKMGTSDDIVRVVTESL